MARARSRRAAPVTFAEPRIRTLTVLGQDPSLADRDGVVTVRIEIPCERLAPGPQGARFHVVDCDASTQTLYRPANIAGPDAFVTVTDAERLVASRAFHAQNVYGIAMETLGCFEKALGRRVPWSIPGGSLDHAGNGRGHVLKIAPHAFSAANAYYSRRDEGLLFGYFPSQARQSARSPKTIFTCLSRDVVAHETSHAVLDGLHPRYTDPSSRDQAAFHEGFADIVALLSAFRHERVVKAAFQDERDWISSTALTAERLRRTVLAGLAEQLGDELGQVRGNPLRSSASIEPNPGLYRSDEYRQPHKRGELLVAAVMNAFLGVWLQRLRPLQGKDGKQAIARERVVEEGAEAAGHVLTMAIRALDYAPPVDLDFPDYLTALLTADHEVYPDDSKYEYRKALVKWFGSYGISPVQSPNSPEPGMWSPPTRPVSYRRNHFESLTHNLDEAFHFVWENRDPLELHSEAFTYVPSVNRCVRVDRDGFTVQEIIIQYVQILGVQARELRRLNVRAPEGMAPSQNLTLYGGGVLVLDEFGRLKFHVGSDIKGPSQTERLQCLWAHGYFQEKRQAQRRFAELHRARAMGSTRFLEEGW